MNKLDLTVYIPVHSVESENFTEMLTEAVDSVFANEVQPSRVVILRCKCKDVTNAINELNIINKYDNLEIIENSGDKSYQNMVNYAAENCETKYMSILEFDDKFSNYYFKNASEYINAYGDEVDLFLPIISEINDEGKFENYTNEAAWAHQFTDEMGFITHEVLLEYQNISLNGMIINVETFKNVGKLKPSIKLVFNYEFLLRYTHQNNKVFVIPKVGYEHMNLREGSLFWKYKNEDKLTQQESDFWLNTAREEFFYDYDREITYDKPKINVE